MNLLSVDLENCSSVGKLKHDFSFDQQSLNTFMIYAPIGTVKTSLVKPLHIHCTDTKNLYRDQ